MRIAVIGATGNIGRRVCELLEAAGHGVVRASRANGVDAYAGVGLDGAVAGADAVIDVTSNNSSGDEGELVDFFGVVGRNTAAAAARAGVGHLVLLSVVGLQHDRRVAHYRGKQAQEAAVREGGVPFTIVRAAQFHDYPEIVVERTLSDGVAQLAPLLLQPVDPQEVAEYLVEVALGAPHGAVVEIAGPATEDLVDMARRLYARKGVQLTLVPSWRGPAGTSTAGEVMLPGPGARLGKVRFDEWLAARD
jgi:uncharacterized protein YbjT (DUF2867 family)